MVLFLSSKDYSTRTKHVGHQKFESQEMKSGAKLTLSSSVLSHLKPIRAKCRWDFLFACFGLFLIMKSL